MYADNGLLLNVSRLKLQRMFKKNLVGLLLRSTCFEGDVCEGQFLRLTMVICLCWDSKGGLNSLNHENVNNILGMEAVFFLLAVNIEKSNSF